MEILLRKVGESKTSVDQTKGSFSLGNTLEKTKVVAEAPPKKKKRPTNREPRGSIALDATAEQDELEEEDEIPTKHDKSFIREEASSSDYENSEEDASEDEEEKKEKDENDSHTSMEGRTERPKTELPSRCLSIPVSSPETTIQWKPTSFILKDFNEHHFKLCCNFMKELKPPLKIDFSGSEFNFLRTEGLSKLFTSTKGEELGLLAFAFVRFMQYGISKIMDPRISELPKLTDWYSSLFTEENETLMSENFTFVFPLVVEILLFRGSLKDTGCLKMDNFIIPKLLLFHIAESIAEIGFQSISEKLKNENTKILLSDYPDYVDVDALFLFSVEFKEDPFNILSFTKRLEIVNYLHNHINLKSKEDKMKTPVFVKKTIKSFDPLTGFDREKTKLIAIPFNSENETVPLLLRWFVNVLNIDHYMEGIIFTICEEYKKSGINFRKVHGDIKDVFLSDGYVTFLLEIFNDYFLSYLNAWKVLLGI